MDSGSEAVRLTNADIDNALENNHFQVIFQPIFHLGTGALLRVESFVRWTHPGLGVLPPGAFISFFESQGRMGELTRHVLTTSLDAYTAWRGTDGPGFSVNLAQSDLIEPGFAEWFSGLLAERDFPAGLITLECPALPTDVSLGDASRYFSRLKETGARLAMEVRGRANDLLRTIDPFPFDEVKTGGSAILRFARTMRGGPGLSAISELLELAKENEADIVAVGVEDQASLKALAGLGFTAAQGNYLATIGDLEAIAPNIVNSVRTVLDLPALDEDAAAAADPVETTGFGATESGTTETQSAETASATAPLSAEKVALLKQKAARVAAKRRAERKAAGAKQAAAGGGAEPVEVIVADESVETPAEAATETIDDARQSLADAAAQREADENARRLQSRLAQAYETPRVEGGTTMSSETVTEPSSPAKPAGAASGKRPATRASGTASKVTHRSADKPEPVPEPKKAGSKPETATATDASDPAAPVAPEPRKAAGTASPPASKAPTAPDQDTEKDAAPVDAGPAAAGRAKATPANPVRGDGRDMPLPLSRVGMTSSLQLTGIADLPPNPPDEKKTVSKAPATENPDAGMDMHRAPEPVSEPPETSPDDSIAAAETDFPAAAMPAGREQPAPAGEADGIENTPSAVEEPADNAADTIREIWTEADPEEFRSEDEVLDEAFAGTAELDPTDTHPEDVEGPVEIDSTEREIAGRLRNRPRRRRKSWLMRKHRVWPTHFWPVSWKRHWQEKKERSQIRTYVIEPGQKMPWLTDDN